MEDVSRTKNRSNRIVTFAAIALTVSLVAYPILRVYIPGPFWAKWMLAYAANERIAGRIENALGALDESYERDPGIVRDGQYWQTRLNIAFGRSPVQYEEVESLVEHAIASMKAKTDIQRRSRISMYLASNLLEKQYWDLAIDVMEELFDVPQRRAPEQNNLLAYSRSLSKTNLKQALIEVDLALQRDNRPEYMDTKGWVLYQIGDYETALTFANRSVNELIAKIKGMSPKLYELLTQETVSLPSNDPPALDLPTFDFPNMDLPRPESIDDAVVKDKEAVNESEPKTKASAAVTTRLFELAKNLAVVRYHRARILEGLGRTEEANQDFEWIKSLGIEDYSELY